MAWGTWAIIAIVLLIVEMFTVDFTFLMLAGGALAATLASFFGAGIAVQIIAFVIVSAALLLFVRPLIKKHLNAKAMGGESNVYAMAGKRARALTDVNEASGRVKVGGEVWSARSESGVIPAESEVVVVSVQGAHVVVAAASNVPQA